jgi:hypothetical protein
MFSIFVIYPRQRKQKNEKCNSYTYYKDIVQYGENGFDRYKRKTEESDWKSKYFQLWVLANICNKKHKWSVLSSWFLFPSAIFFLATIVLLIV